LGKTPARKGGSIKSEISKFLHSPSTQRLHPGGWGTEGQNFPRNKKAEGKLPCLVKGEKEEQSPSNIAEK